ncbi:MAG: VWA domain-containing protein [Candidatus Binatia bacterium]|nr:MAG: VWA domain-containing protein [Candidatus Binatia bacterium]
MGLGNPAALWLGSLVALLVLFYLLERLRRKVLVPSLVLWEHLEPDPLARRRFRPDWLFALQLAALLAVVGALGRPFFRGGASPPAPREILVLDASASMKAREGKSTRFEVAKRRAARIVQAWPPAAEGMLLLAGRVPEIRSGPTTDRAALLRSLREASAEDVPGDLSAAVALAARTRARATERTEIHVFTDLPLSSLPSSLRPLVNHHQLGSEQDNVAITGIEVFQAPFARPDDTRVFVEVRNFAYETRHGFLTLSVRGEPFWKTGFTLAPREASTFAAPSIPGGGILEARIESHDALPTDDAAYAWVEPSEPRTVLFVSEPTPLAPEILAIDRVLPGLFVEFVAPEDYPRRARLAHDAAIFHKVVPPKLSPGALYVFPSRDTEFFRVHGTVTVTGLPERDPRHELSPLLPGVPSFRSSLVTRVEAPPDARPIFRLPSGGQKLPLAFTVRRNRERIACLATDLETGGLRRNDDVSTLVLFLALVEWVSRHDANAPAVLRTGDVFEAPPDPFGEPVEVLFPSGRSSALSATTPRIELREAGIYRLRGSRGTKLVLANFFHPEESDIARGEPRTTRAEKKERDSSPRPERTELSWWLLASALLLLAVEWGAWRRRNPT